MVDSAESVVVRYQCQGKDIHTLSLGSPFLADISLDYTGIPAAQRAGTAARLLLASALYCFASTLGSALQVRGVDFKSIKGRAIAEKEEDDYHRTRVSRIRIEIDAEVDPDDLPVLERCRKVMEKGCLITYSLYNGIEVEHTIHAKETL